MDGFRKKELLEFIEHINIDIKDIELLDSAFCHTSFAYENNLDKNNERLEFLGDAILGLITSEELYKRHPDIPEGALSKIRSQLVSRKSLTHKAKLLELDKLIKLGKGENQTGGRERISILAGVFEAVLGAVYLDTGIDAARKFVTEYVINADKFVFDGKIVYDYKSDLQEIVQRKYQTIPEYIIVDEKGPDHQKEFKAQVFINGKPMGTGKGFSKKEAEFSAAEIAFRSMKNKITDINLS